jgi:hypothetical protein
MKTMGLRTMSHMLSAGAGEGACVRRDVPTVRSGRPLRSRSEAFLDDFRFSGDVSMLHARSLLGNQVRGQTTDDGYNVYTMYTISEADIGYCC